MQKNSRGVCTRAGGLHPTRDLGQTQLVSSVVKPPMGFMWSQRGTEEEVLPVLQGSGSPLGPQDVQKVL